ncbi:MAG: CDP-alcohol phosphatidyltransferase family protein [Chthoniobacterales bacterium]
MPLYEPTSRRPIGQGFRVTARFATRVCVKSEVHPDTISYASIVAAAIAAVCFWKSGQFQWLLFLAPLFCYLRLWFNMLDGMVALASGKASWRGEILNDLPDRVSDVLIFAGVAHSGWMNPFFAYWAAIFALLTAYVGMFGQAVGVHREFTGVMSKPWRMVTLHIGAWITLAVVWAHGSGVIARGLTILDLTCIIIVAGCIETIAVRLKRIMAALRAKSATH